MTKMRRRTLLAGAAASAGLAAAGTFVPARFAIGQQAKVKLGLMLPYTGTYAQLGQAITDAFKLAIMEQGGKLGGREVEFAVVDDESDPSKAPENANKLVTRDKVGRLCSRASPGAHDLRAGRMDNGRCAMKHRTVGRIVGVVTTITALLALNVGVADAHCPHDSITDIALSPAFDTDRTVFAISRQRLMRSTNMGTTWGEVVAGFDQPDVTHIAAAPSDRNVMYASVTNGGVYRSVNGGRSWARTASRP